MGIIYPRQCRHEPWTCYSQFAIDDVILNSMSQRVGHRRLPLYDLRLRNVTISFAEFGVNTMCRRLQTLYTPDRMASASCKTRDHTGIVLREQAVCIIGELNILIDPLCCNFWKGSRLSTSRNGTLQVIPPARGDLQRDHAHRSR